MPRRSIRGRSVRIKKLDARARYPYNIAAPGNGPLHEVLDLAHRQGARIS